MKGEYYHFTVDLPGGLTDVQIESVLPTFIFIEEKSSDQPKISVAREIRVLKWRKSKLSNGEWLVKSDWQVAS